MGLVGFGPHAGHVGNDGVEGVVVEHIGVVFDRVGNLGTVGHTDGRVAVGLYEVAFAVKEAPEHVEHLLPAGVEDVASTRVEEVTLHAVTLDESARAAVGFVDGDCCAWGEQTAHGEAADSGSYDGYAFHKLYDAFDYL